MIPLQLPAEAEADEPYVARLCREDRGHPADAVLITSDRLSATFSGRHGLLSIDGLPCNDLMGDVVLVQPAARRIDRVLRSGSAHNTLLVTERCDQLCLMCSQPPKKTHVDRFALLETACLLAEPNSFIGISGGEPTLYKHDLLGLIERVLGVREDIEFHVLSNGQHFGPEDIGRLRAPLYRRVTWGVPLYSSDAAAHDRIVGKDGAFERLNSSMASLLLAGSRVELRTVVLQDNQHHLGSLARHVTTRLGFVESWSIMQLENIGFARNRWSELFLDHSLWFDGISAALNEAILHGIDVRLFNFPVCSVPEPYRRFAEPSISDWKRKYAPACDGCSARHGCSGFFAWHPERSMLEGVRPI
jgi:His-Xaa-Ser system radical SAM maturase HxsC